MKTEIAIFLLFFTFLLSSCESEKERKERLAREEQYKIELEQQQAEEEKANSLLLEQSRIEREAMIEKERKEKEIYDKYIDNSLQTGSTPYSSYYGGNSSCNDYGCSQIKVKTSNSDVLVTIKNNDKVIRHAYIRSGSSFSFSLPNGTYQPFFYYGKGWFPEKEMKNGEIRGGFISNEDFGKDEPQTLENNILEYELILQPNGNFSTEPSNPEEAL